MSIARVTPIGSFLWDGTALTNGGSVAAYWIGDLRLKTQMTFEGYARIDETDLATSTTYKTRDLEDPLKMRSSNAHYWDASLRLVRQETE